MLELLAPAGSPEAVTAAVQSGADAVYLGCGTFNARRNAKNFSREEFAAALSYCHIRDVKVYLTLNTLITDRELASAIALAADASALGVDAVLVQDLGLLRALRLLLPDLTLEAAESFQITDAAGVRVLEALGAKRLLLPPQLSSGEMRYLCRRT